MSVLLHVLVTGWVWRLGRPVWAMMVSYSMGGSRSVIGWASQR